MDYARVAGPVAEALTSLGAPLLEVLVLLLNWTQHQDKAQLTKRLSFVAVHTVCEVAGAIVGMCLLPCCPVLAPMAGRAVGVVVAEIIECMLSPVTPSARTPSPPIGTAPVSRFRVVTVPIPARQGFQTFAVTRSETGPGGMTREDFPVEKRFSSFYRFNGVLRYELAGQDLPALPWRGFWVGWCAALVEHRRAGLERYLQRLAQHSEAQALLKQFLSTSDVTA